MMKTKCSASLRGLLAALCLSGAFALTAEEAANANDYKQAFEAAQQAYKDRQWEKAAEWFVKARELAQTDAEKYAVDSRLMYCFSYNKQYEKSIAAAEEALQYPKLTPRARNQTVNLIANSLIRLKRFDEGLAVVEKQLAEPARDDNVYYTTLLCQGIMLKELKKYPEAIAAFKKAEAFRQADQTFRTKLNWYLGSTLMLTGDKDAAKGYFEKAAAENKGWFAADAGKQLKKLQAQ